MRAEAAGRSGSCRGTQQLANMFALYSHRYLHLSRFIMSLGGNNNELACVYAALILNDEGLEINSDNIAKILKASNIETEAYWPTLFAKLCKGKDITAMISSVGSGGGGGGGGSGSGGSAAPAAPAAGGGGGGGSKAAPEPEPEVEEEDMGFDLFD